MQTTNTKHEYKQLIQTPITNTNEYKIRVPTPNTQQNKYNKRIQTKQKKTRSATNEYKKQNEYQQLRQTTIAHTRINKKKKKN